MAIEAQPLGARFFWNIKACELQKPRYEAMDGDREVDGGAMGEAQSVGGELRLIQ